MRHFRHIFFQGTQLLAIAAGLVLACTSARGQDPVEDLKQDLAVRAFDLDMLQYREKVIHERIDALKTIGDLRRALLLPSPTYWHLDVESAKVREVDEKLRARVGKMLTEKLAQAAGKGAGTISKVAVANMIAEMGPKVPSTTGGQLGDLSGFTRTLTPILLDLVKDEEIQVRKEALRALGTINADPKVVAGTFGSILSARQKAEKQPSADEAYLAAAGLVQMLRVANSLTPKASTKSKIEVLVTKDELTLIAKEAIAAAALGLATDSRPGDPDPRTRAMCLVVLKEVMEAMEPPNRPFKSEDFPPRGRPLTEAEQAEINAKLKLLRGEVADVKDVMETIAGQGDALTRALNDSHRRVQQAAADALEPIGFFGMRLRHRVQSALDHLPRAKRDAEKITLPLDDMARKTATAANLSALLKNPETPVQVRRKVLKYLIYLEELAEPASAVIIGRLADPDPFVRWAAAQALENFSPDRLPANNPEAENSEDRDKSPIELLSRLLGESDAGVKLAATQTLTRIGSAGRLLHATTSDSSTRDKIKTQARQAASALAEAIVLGDTDFRVAAIQALNEFGSIITSDQQSSRITAKVLTNLTNSLSGSETADARVRQAAAFGLGHWGRHVNRAMPNLGSDAASNLRKLLADGVQMLRQALGDEDPDVRINAGDAILAIER
jgi:HEAT repeat protein